VTQGERVNNFRTPKKSNVAGLGRLSLLSSSTEYKKKPCRHVAWGPGLRSKGRRAHDESRKKHREETMQAAAEPSERFASKLRGR
jgi:hypothetical protein